MFTILQGKSVGFLNPVNPHRLIDYSPHSGEKPPILGWNVIFFMSRQFVKQHKSFATRYVRFDEKILF